MRHLLTPLTNALLPGPRAAGDDTLASEYVKAHARKVADVMTTNVIAASPNAPLHEIAALPERNSINRVPIVKDGELVGIVPSQSRQSKY